MNRSGIQNIPMFDLKPKYCVVATKYGDFNLMVCNFFPEQAIGPIYRSNGPIHVHRHFTKRIAVKR